MIFHRINIPTVTNTIGEPGKQDSTQNSSDHIQQKQTDENKELNITLEQAKDIALQKAGVSEQVYFKEVKLDFEDTPIAIPSVIAPNVVNKVTFLIIIIHLHFY